MNIYFLVEGKRTEMKVYPRWLSYLVPQLQRVTSPQAVSTNNYYIFSGNGYPSLLTHLSNAVADVNDAPNYNYLVICLDAEEQTLAYCKQEILDYMAAESIRLNPNIQFEIIVQNRCIETWFLGNTKIFKQNPTQPFLNECVTHYNVRKNDPELMEKLPDFEASTAVFHTHYLQHLLAERNISYSKNNPKAVVEAPFLNALIARSQKTKHIQSFQYFVDFCQQIRAKINS